MMTAASPCRTYIVYRNALFAQGVRSVLERESGVQIVGMENDLTRATIALRALQPEAILVEEPMESTVPWSFLEWAKASRIVTFSLNHAHATVYDPHRTAVDAPADLIKALQGVPTLEKVPGALADTHRVPDSKADRFTAVAGSDPTRPDTVCQRTPSKVRGSKSRCDTRE